MDRGEKELFVELLDGYKDNLFRVAYSITGSRQIAEDCLSETILKGYQAFGKLKEIQYFNSWIMRILINECKDELRKRKSMVEVEEIEALAVSRDKNDLLVQSVMGLLPIDLRQIVALKLFSGYTFSEISSLVRLSENQVKKRYYKAMEMLEERKDEFYG